MNKYKKRNKILNILAYILATASFISIYSAASTADYRDAAESAGIDLSGEKIASPKTTKTMETCGCAGLALSVGLLAAKKQERN